MSYTPDEQLLTPPIEEALEGLRKTKDAIEARLADPERWIESHLHELQALMHKIDDLSLELRLTKKRNR